MTPGRKKRPQIFLHQYGAGQHTLIHATNNAPRRIRSVFRLSDKTCRAVMVPRTNVVAVDISTPAKVLGLDRRTLYKEVAEIEGHVAGHVAGETEAETS